MGTDRAPTDRTAEQVHRVAPVTPSGYALAACRQRLRSVVAILVEANATLHEAVDARDRALRELREAEREQDAFIVAAVHELKTPLTAIKGRVQLLRRPGRGGAAADQARVLARLEAIEDGADRLAAALDVLIAEVERPLPEPSGADRPER